MKVRQRLSRGVWLGAIVWIAACTVDLPDRFHDGGKHDSEVSKDGRVHDGAGTAPDVALPPGCGDGKLGDGEVCDVAIAVGETGACPTRCDDGLACTKDTLKGGGTCEASCSYSPITVCKNGDGCCASGCTAATDDDCSKTCGNGKVDDKETCDTKIVTGQPGACPTSCEDGSACTKDTLLNGATCAAQCSHVPITTCTNGDGCCPTGCTTKTDNDCSVTCGDGVKDKEEKCDTAIAAGQPGACPSPKDCEDGNACTKDTLLNAGSCNAQCASTAITQCKSGDGCCPSGCTNNNDNDCSASCGNGAKDSGEACDKGIAAGKPGACPTSCDDEKVCTKDTLQNGGTCSAVCVYTNISACKTGDGCCPSGCTNNNDKDCSKLCGNGAKESGETCDTAIASGHPGACPTSCNDNKSCTKDTLQNSGTCTAECIYTNITACIDGDGCCPGNCNANNDNDCPPVCGNGVVESGELCDSGVSAGKPGACPTSCPVKTCESGTVTGTGCKRQCAYSDVSNGTSCTGGKCYGGSCCTGCWDGSICQAGTSLTVCGDAGGGCKSCNDNNACTVDTCTAGGTCTHSNLSNGTTCSGGKCYSGSCCTGCWDGSICQAGTSVASCGTKGASCAACGPGPGGSTCQPATCSAGTCGYFTAHDGTSCTGGKCYGGSCCTGCWDGSSCQAGTSVTVCGAAGGVCKSCNDTNVCTVDTCTSAGTCSHTDVSDTKCTDGVCHSGSCCTGCWDGSTCQAGTSTSACGIQGRDCEICIKDEICTPNGFCLPGH